MFGYKEVSGGGAERNDKNNLQPDLPLSVEALCMRPSINGHETHSVDLCFYLQPSLPQLITKRTLDMGSSTSNDQAQGTIDHSTASKPSHHSSLSRQRRVNQSGGRVVVFVEANYDLYITSTDRLIGKIAIPTKFVRTI
jgi:hypothetical protein